MAPTFCFLFCILSGDPVPVNNYAQECAIIRPSRSDTADTLRQIATANAKCRAARGEGAKK